MASTLELDIEMLVWPPCHSTLCKTRVQGQVVYTCASVTKQYDLVPTKGPWCSAVEKLTVGVALLWSCVTDLVVYT